MNKSYTYIQSIEDSIRSRHPNASIQEMYDMLTSKKNKLANICFKETEHRYLVYVMLVRKHKIFITHDQWHNESFIPNLKILQSNLLFCYDYLLIKFRQQIRILTNTYF